MEKASVTMKNFAFNPSTVTIKRGMEVVWNNEDNAPHTVVNDPDGSMFKSDTIEMGENYSYTFNAVGNYPYHCGLHPTMEGTVIVED